MFKLIMKHTELKSLSWTFAEFHKLVLAGEFSRPEVFAPRLQVKVLGFTFDMPVFGIVKVTFVRVRVA